MQRRHLISWFAVSLASAARAAADPTQSLRGKLIPGPKPVLETGQGRIALNGDEGTMLVLGDKRLAGFDFEVVGVPAGEPGVFQVGPLHKRAMFVHKDGKRLMVTYWCEVCSIRTYTPGVCMCCQDETAVDLKEKLESDDIKAR